MVNESGDTSTVSTRPHGPVSAAQQAALGGQEWLRRSPLFRPRVELDTTTSHPARRYDYWLGGKDNFAADRRSGDAIRKAFPWVVAGVWENRRFLHRVVAWLAREQGIDQFLDIGVGLPHEPNVHQIVQEIRPAGRVVYVDNEPLVMVHARALLTGTGEGRTDYIQADLRDPDSIIGHSAVTQTLDLSRPLALLLLAVLHFLPDDERPYDHVRRLVGALPSGSVVAVTHATLDPLPSAEVTRVREFTAANPAHGPFRSRSRDEVAAFLDGLTLLDPGVVSAVEWLPRDEPAPTHRPDEVATYAAVAVKP